MCTITDFYNGKATPDGFTIDDCINASDKWLEKEHHYIQYCFPLREMSAHNPTAPVLDDDVITEFRGNPDMQKKLMHMTHRMIKFYESRACWFADEPTRAAYIKINARDHNVKRISRIMKSLHALSPELFDLFVEKVTVPTNMYYQCFQSAANKAIDRLSKANVELVKHVWRAAATYR